MANIRVRDKDEDHRFGFCQCLWITPFGHENCPNEAEYILDNIGNNGFAVMCEFHYENFAEEYGFDDIMVHEYTIEYHEQLIKILEEKGPHG